MNIGLVVDEGCICPTVSELLLWIEAEPSLHLSSLIVQKGMGGSGLASNMFSGWGWKLVSALEELRLRKRAPLTPSMANNVRTALVVRPTGSGKLGAYVLGNADIAALQSKSFDVLIQCGTGTWSGAALGCATLGMIVFNDIADESARGGPPGFWEVCDRTAKTQFMIKHVSINSSAPAPLRHGYFPTQSFALRNANLQVKLASSHLRRMLLAAAETGALPQRQPAIKHSAPRRGTPNLAQAIGYLCKLAARTAAFRFRAAIGLREQWGVAYAHANWRDANLCEGLKINNPKGRYFADPFLLQVANETFCFVEDFVQAKGRAVISVLKLGPGGYSILGQAIEEDFHLSFPYLFRYEDELYMCPESHEAKEIRVYRCTGFPLEWRLQSVCMAGVSAVDTMIFPAGDRWWMLTNIDDASVGNNFSELHLFSAPSPLSAQWKSHPMNPLVVDPEFARNAGLLHHGGATYRVSQARGFRVYGTSASISEIKVINSSNYEEKLIKTIHPTHEHGLTGVHHFNAADGYTVWDQKRWAWGQ